MDTILNFFSNLILFTAGLAVVTFWIIIIFIVVDEILDLIFPDRIKSEEDES